jgi:hypothetical protein
VLFSGTYMSNQNPKKDGSTGEWRARTGAHPALDTGKLRALDGASDTENPEAEAPGEDPYNRTIPPVLESSAERGRRLLDDMRRLSEMIKAGKSSK